MEGFPGDRFRHGFGLCAIAPEHNHAHVVVVHRQAPIVLCLFHFPHVLARLDTTEGQIASVRDKVGREFRRVTSVNPYVGFSRERHASAWLLEPGWRPALPESYWCRTYEMDMTSRVCAARERVNRQRSPRRGHAHAVIPGRIPNVPPRQTGEGIAVRSA